MTKPTIFISYSHKDEACMERLVSHLGVLQHEGLFDLWYDRRIDGGEDLETKIEEGMAKASVAILLVSRHYLTSNFILKKEVPRLMERRENEGIHILPIIVKPCVWEDVKWLSCMKLLPKDGEPLSSGNEHQIDTNMKGVVEEVAEKIDSILADIDKSNPIEIRKQNNLESIDEQQIPLIKNQFVDCLTNSIDYDHKTVTEYRSLLRDEKRSKFPDVLTNDEFLKRANFIIGGRLTIAGALLFSRHPTNIVPSAKIRCTIYPGTEKGKTRNYSEIDGPLFLQITQARDFVTANIEKMERLTSQSSRPETIYQYPMICVREIIANALCHRSYEDIQRMVYIRIYSNRIEFSSPGNWFPKPLNEGESVNLSDLKSESIQRNFNLAHAIASINLVEAEGSGINTAILDCEENRAEIPTVMQKDGYTIVTAFPNSQENKVSLAKLPSSNPELFGRDKELEMLNEAWANPKTNIVSLVAWGGVGKTALVNKWLSRMRDEQYRGAERIYGWSFYSHGASEGKQVSTDFFITSALKFFGDDELDNGNHWEKAERLANLIKKKRTLLILDGLEPLQNPPGEEQGHIKDPVIKYLLRELAHHNIGLCVITTRLDVDDLKEFEGTTLQNIPLEQLSPEAGATLLENLGVKGTYEELKEAVSKFGGHALALTLLGGYLKVVYNGDVRQRDKIENLTKEKKHGGHARRIMESYEKWFKGKPELNILYIMGLFDRPAEGGAIQELKFEPAINGLTSDLKKLPHEKWQIALNHLRNVGLLADEDGEPDKLDCHPLIREHFGDKLKKNNPDAWKEAHSRLYEYYKDTTKELPETIEEMAPLYQAVAHGCQAGRYKEALDEVYWCRIQRGNEYFNHNKLGSFGTELATLSGFFDSLWSQPVAELTEVAQGFILNAAGFCLKALGRLAEAAQPIQAGLDVAIVQENWINAARGANNLSEIHLIFGNVTIALDYAKKNVEYADRSADASSRMGARTTLADALHQAGRKSEAEAVFIEAEGMQKERQPEYPYLHSLQGFMYCEFLLSQGKYRDVLALAGQTLEWAEEQKYLLDIALDHLSIGCAHLLQTQQEGSNDYTQAETHLNQAVEGLRRAGAQEFIVRGLLARAELNRVHREFPKAQHDLDEGMNIAERAGMGRYMADCHLEYARLYLAMGEKEDDSRKNLDTAREMIEEMRYHRRDKDVSEIEEQLVKL